MRYGCECDGRVVSKKMGWETKYVAFYNGTRLRWRKKGGGDRGERIVLQCIDPSPCFSKNLSFGLSDVDQNHGVKRKSKSNIYLLLLLSMYLITRQGHQHCHWKHAPIIICSWYIGASV